LTAVGLYGVLAYHVAQRTGEIGLRVALGASRADIARLVAGQGLRLVLAGLLLGLIAAAAGSRLLARFLFGVSPLDPLSFGAAAAVLTVVALLASRLAARRALRIEPTMALPHDP
jgi:putative ABC transport system permease protein